MAYVEHRGEGRWRVRWRDPEGAEHSKTFPTKEKARSFRIALEGSLENGTYVDPALTKILLGDWIATWLASIGPSLKSNTRAGYDSMIRARLLPAFGRYPVSKIKPSDVQRWIGEMQQEGLSPSTIRQAVVILKSSLDAAVRDGRLARNPCAGLKLPRIEHREAAFFEPKAVEEIIGRFPEPYDLLARILGVLGLRWGESVALRRKNVDLLRKRLRVEQSLAEVKGRFEFGPTKTHAARSVPLTPQLSDALSSHLEGIASDPETLLFTGPKGGPLRYRYAYMKLWRPALEDLGLPPVGLHALRHSAAARMISAGASPKVVQSVMGHRSAAFTLTVYGHLFDADLDDLAARLDLPAASPRPEGSLRGA